MAYSKVIQIGSAGQLSITEAAGIATVQVSLSEAVGGGSVAGAVKASVSAEVSISAMELVDAGLALAEAQFPSVASLIAAAKTAIDAEVAKL